MDRHPCSCFRGWDYSNRTGTIPNGRGDDICCNCGGIVPPKGALHSKYIPGVIDCCNCGGIVPPKWGDSSGFHEDLHDYKINEYAQKAWDNYMDFKEEDALHYINMALDLDDSHANNWNIKAIVLEGMKRYAEAEECYSRSLELSPHNTVYDNKARMLYDWALQLLEESKKLVNGLDMLDEAYDKLIKAIRTLPGENTEEDLEKYLKLRDSINFCIGQESRYQGNLEALKRYDKNELFTIAGMHFYKNDAALTPGMPLRLVREQDNEFDRDAIAVYVDGEKIGYVANGDHTKFELTSSASQLRDKIEDDAQGEYLFYLERYGVIQFNIARIIK